MRAQLRSLFGGLFRRVRLEQQMDQELRAHLDAYVEDLIRSGVPAAEAERQAQLEFGGMEAVKEECREARGLRWPDELRQDVHYAFRTLRKAPGFTAAAVLSLAIGIGVNTAIYSVVSAALIRPLPYADPGHLVAVYETQTALGEKFGSFANANYADLRANVPSLKDIAAHTSTGVNLMAGGEAEQLKGRLVTGNMFTLLGVTAHLGRTLIPDDAEAGKPRVIVLSHDLWQRRFGGDPNIAGRTLTVEGEPYTVVGVMPHTFRFPGARDEFWLPLRLDAKALQERSNHNLHCIGRLKDGASLGQTQREASFIAGRLRQQYPKTNAGIDFYLAPLQDSLTRSVRAGLIVLMIAVSFLLLIACANVGNLILTRSTVRRRELAVRAALGAGRLRLVRQMLTESLCLSSLGGIAALILCFTVTKALQPLLPPALTPAGEVQFDAGVLGFGLIVSIVAGMLCGLAPVLLISRGDLRNWLTGSSRSATGSGTETRARGVLVACEVSLTLVLLIGAGLLLRSFVRLMDVDPGFQPGHVLTVRFALPQFLYPSQDKKVSFYERLLGRMETIPGVVSAALVTSSPLVSEGGSSWFIREGRPAERPEELSANNRVVSERYFSTLRIPVREGRTFSAQDSAGAPLVAVINESMARKFWPGESPVGKRFQFYGKPWVQIVGVVGDVHQVGLDIDPSPEIYRPYSQDAQVWLAPRALIIRTAAEPSAFAPAVRQEFRALDRAVPIYGLDSMDELLEKTTAPRRFQMLFVGVFGCVALALAAVGIYGIVAYVSAQRNHEIGIRIALGANGADVLRMMLHKALSPVLAGLCIGLVLAISLSRFLSSELYRVEATDPLTFSTVSLLMIVIAGIAAFVPCRRASRTDPMLALRNE